MDRYFSDRIAPRMDNDHSHHLAQHLRRITIPMYKPNVVYPRRVLPRHKFYSGLVSLPRPATPLIPFLSRRLVLPYRIAPMHPGTRLPVRRSQRPLIQYNQSKQQALPNTVLGRLHPSMPPKGPEHYIRENKLEKFGPSLALRPSNQPRSPPDTGVNKSPHYLEQSDSSSNVSNDDLPEQPRKFDSPHNVSHGASPMQPERHDSPDKGEYYVVEPTYYGDPSPQTLPHEAGQSTSSVGSDFDDFPVDSGKYDSSPNSSYDSLSDEPQKHGLAPNKDGYIVEPNQHTPGSEVSNVHHKKIWLHRVPHQNEQYNRSVILPEKTEKHDFPNKREYKVKSRPENYIVVDGKPQLPGRPSYNETRIPNSVSREIKIKPNFSLSKESYELNRQREPGSPNRAPVRGPQQEEHYGLPPTTYSDMLPKNPKYHDELPNEAVHYYNSPSKENYELHGQHDHPNKVETNPKYHIIEKKVPTTPGSPNRAPVRVPLQTQHNKLPLATYSDMLPKNPKYHDELPNEITNRNHYSRLGSSLREWEKNNSFDGSRDAGESKRQVLNKKDQQPSGKGTEQNKIDEKLNKEKISDKKNNEDEDGSKKEGEPKKDQMVDLIP